MNKEIAIYRFISRLSCLLQFHFPFLFCRRHSPSLSSPAERGRKTKQKKAINKKYPKDALRINARLLLAGARHGF